MGALSVRALVATALAAFLASAAGCNATGTNTQVLVIVNAESGVRARARTLRIDVRSGPAGSQLDELTPRESRTGDSFTSADWPRSIVLVPTDRDASRVYLIEVSALDASDAPVAVARAFSGYVAGTTRVLTLWLRDACIDMPCDAQTTCDEGRCVMVVFTDPTTLPFRESDAGPDIDAARSDTGIDVGPGDAGPDDAGVGGDAWVCDPSLCDDHIACTDDACGPAGCVHTPRDSMCDDHELCTTDACDPAAPGGCSHDPNAVACDDGLFCNGLDTCAGGTCATHAGSPCGALMCVESGHTCSGCDGTHPCPAPMTGSWSSCAYLDPDCSTSGTRSRLVVTFTCNAGTSQCEPSNGVDTEACGARTTEGNACGSATCDMPGPCGYSSICDESGLSPRTCHALVCRSGHCADEPYSSPLSCSRNTDGDACDDGNACTAPDRCTTEICGGAPACDAGTPPVDAGADGGMDAAVPCNDGWDCTTDTGFFPACSATPNDGFCNYGGACSIGTCSPSSPGHDFAGCVYTYACPDAGFSLDGGGAPCQTGLVCDDGIVCTNDTCMPTSPFADSNGCVFMPTSGCRDGG